MQRKWYFPIHIELNMHKNHDNLYIILNIKADHVEKTPKIDMTRSYVDAIDMD